MLKLVRNTLGASKILIDDQGQEIQWAYLKELHKLQVAEGFNLGNKLSIRHINYEKQKMKVKLAAQLMSQSVADALVFCKDILQLQTFQGAAATIKFLKTFNTLFDIFNSKSLQQHGYSKPINSENFQQIQKILKDTANYISALKLRVSTERIINIIDSKKKTGFLGFLINIKNILMLYEEVCEKDNLLSYIPTYKLSQDHLEMIFSVIRSHGGCNNNPTANQFKTALKKIISHAELSIPTTGNCIPIEEIAILLPRILPQKNRFTLLTIIHHVGQIFCLLPKIMIT